MIQIKFPSAKLNDLGIFPPFSHPAYIWNFISIFQNNARLLWIWNNKLKFIISCEENKHHQFNFLSFDLQCISVIWTYIILNKSNARLIRLQLPRKYRKVLHVLKMNWKEEGSIFVFDNFPVSEIGFNKVFWELFYEGEICESVLFENFIPHLKLNEDMFHNLRE